MSFPSFIPEPIVITTVTIKTNVEPILIWRVPFLFLDITKGPKATADMIKHTVQYNLDIVIMQILADI